MSRIPFPIKGIHPDHFMEHVSRQQADEYARVFSLHVRELASSKTISEFHDTIKQCSLYWSRQGDLISASLQFYIFRLLTTILLTSTPPNEYPDNNTQFTPIFAYLDLFSEDRDFIEEFRRIYFLQAFSKCQSLSQALIALDCDLPGAISNCVAHYFRYYHSPQTGFPTLCEQVVDSLTNAPIPNQFLRSISGIHAVPRSIRLTRSPMVIYNQHLLDHKGGIARLTKQLKVGLRKDQTTRVSYRIEVFGSLRDQQSYYQFQQQRREKGRSSSSSSSSPPPKPKKPKTLFDIRLLRYQRRKELLLENERKSMITSIIDDSHRLELPTGKSSVDGDGDGDESCFYQQTAHYGDTTAFLMGNIDCHDDDDDNDDMVVSRHDNKNPPSNKRMYVDHDHDDDDESDRRNHRYTNHDTSSNRHHNNNHTDGNNNHHHHHHHKTTNNNHQHAAYPPPHPQPPLQSHPQPQPQPPITETKEFSMQFNHFFETNHHNGDGNDNDHGNAGGGGGGGTAPTTTFVDPSAFSLTTKLNAPRSIQHAHAHHHNDNTHDNNNNNNNSNNNNNNDHGFDLGMLNLNPFSQKKKGSQTLFRGDSDNTSRLGAIDLGDDDDDDGGGGGAEMTGAHTRHLMMLNQQKRQRKQQQLRQANLQLPVDKTDEIYIEDSFDDDEDDDDDDSSDYFRHQQQQHQQQQQQQQQQHQQSRHQPTSSKTDQKNEIFCDDDDSDSDSNRHSLNNRVSQNASHPQPQPQQQPQQRRSILTSQQPKTSMPKLGRRSMMGRATLMVSKNTFLEAQKQQSLNKFNSMINTQRNSPYSDSDSNDSDGDGNNYGHVNANSHHNNVRGPSSMVPPHQQQQQQQQQQQPPRKFNAPARLQALQSSNDANMIYNDSDDDDDDNGGGRGGGDHKSHHLAVNHQNSNNAIQQSSHPSQNPWIQPQPQLQTQPQPHHQQPCTTNQHVNAHTHTNTHIDATPYQIYQDPSPTNRMPHRDTLSSVSTTQPHPTQSHPTTTSSYPSQLSSNHQPFARSTITGSIPPPSSSSLSLSSSPPISSMPISMSMTTRLVPVLPGAFTPPPFTPLSPYHKTIELIQALFALFSPTFDGTQGNYASLSRLYGNLVFRPQWSPAGLNESIQHSKHTVLSVSSLSKIKILSKPQSNHFNIAIPLTLSNCDPISLLHDDTYTIDDETKYFPQYNWQPSSSSVTSSLSSSLSSSTTTTASSSSSTTTASPSIPIHAPYPPCTSSLPIFFTSPRQNFLITNLDDTTVRGCAGGLTVLFEVYLSCIVQQRLTADIARHRFILHIPNHAFIVLNEPSRKLLVSPHSPTINSHVILPPSPEILAHHTQQLQQYQQQQQQQQSYIAPPQPQSPDNVIQTDIESPSVHLSPKQIAEWIGLPTFGHSDDRCWKGTIHTFYSSIDQSPSTLILNDAYYQPIVVPKTIQSTPQASFMTASHSDAQVTINPTHHLFNPYKFSTVAFFNHKVHHIHQLHHVLYYKEQFNLPIVLYMISELLKCMYLAHASGLIYHGFQLQDIIVQTCDKAPIRCGPSIIPPNKDLTHPIWLPVAGVDNHGNADHTGNVANIHGQNTTDGFYFTLLLPPTANDMGCILQYPNFTGFVVDRSSQYGKELYRFTSQGQYIYELDIISIIRIIHTIANNYSPERSTPILLGAVSTSLIFSPSLPGISVGGGGGSGSGSHSSAKMKIRRSADFGVLGQDPEVFTAVCDVLDTLLEDLPPLQPGASASSHSMSSSSSSSAPPPTSPSSPVPFDIYLQLHCKRMVQAIRTVERILFTKVLQHPQHSSLFKTSIEELPRNIRYGQFD